jgi:uncharacterized membrane protein
MGQKVTTTTTKGVVLGLILMVIGLAVYFSGMDMNGVIKWLGYIVFLAGIIFSVLQYGKQVNYESTFGNYFAHGFKVSAVVTAIMIVFVVVFILLFPEVKDKALEEARKGMEAKNLPQEQIDKGMEITSKFFMVFLISITLLGYLFFGALASLIGAAVTKKNPPNFQQQIDQLV